MKHRLRLAGLTLSCLTIATVVLAQQCPVATACGLTEAGVDATLHAPEIRIEKARLTRPVEPRRGSTPVAAQATIAPPR